MKKVLNFDKRRRNYCLIFFSVLALSTTIFFIKPLFAVKSDDSINAIVFNKDIKMIEISHLRNHIDSKNNIAIVAKLSQYDVNKQVAQLKLTDPSGEIRAIAYYPLDHYEIGKTYLFEGYIEMTDGKYDYIIEHVTNDY